jgi:hypothetical protein
MSGVFQNIDPTPPHRAASVYPPPFGGGGHTRCFCTLYICKYFVVLSLQTLIKAIIGPSLDPREIFSTNSHTKTEFVYCRFHSPRDEASLKYFKAESIPDLTIFCNLLQNETVGVGGGEVELFV